MKTKKLSLAAGVSVCVLIALLTAVYALLTDLDSGSYPQRVDDL